MRAFFAFLALASLFLPAAGQRRPKPPEITVMEAKARRPEGKILMDGRVRVTAEKPVRGVVVVFDLVAPEGGVVASEKAELDDANVAPGEERAFHSETSDNARAVRFQIRVFDAHEKELRVGNAGPFPIE
jgi:hypothetical protein